MSIKFGIIGYGFMGHEHLAMLSDFDGIDVTAVCDIEPEQLKDVPEGIPDLCGCGGADPGPGSAGGADLCK